MTSDPWKELGYAIRQARLGKGWSLQDLAAEALDNGARKGYVSQVEKGTRNLAPETIDKFDQVLDLPAEMVKAAHMAPPPAKPDPEEDRRDSEAERLLTRVAKDEKAPQVAEALLTTLAYEFAGGQFRDIHTAYVALRKALEAADNLRRRGEMRGDNTESQLNAVLAEVTKLNDEGDRDGADALFDQEERRMRQAHKSNQERMEQEAQALLDRRLDQDRLRNRPDLAADRLIAHLRRTPQPGGMFNAIITKADEWSESGDKAGDIFAMRVGLELAKANYARAKSKKPLAAAALISLGNCYLRLAERSSNERHLVLAQNAFTAAVEKTSKTKEPLVWAAGKDGLGSALMEAGGRASDPQILREAVAAHRAALAVDIKLKSINVKEGWNNLGNALQALGELTRDPAVLSEAVDAQTTALTLKDRQADRLGWEITQNNLALAQRWLGDVTDDLELLTTAREGYAACEAMDYRDDAPFGWAVLQWNIADLALARFRLEPDPALLDEAQDQVIAAKAFFIDGSDYQTGRCDELLAKIAEARASLDPV